MSSLILLPIDLLILLSVFVLSKFIRDNKTSRNALMHNKELISFCPLDLQTSLPRITANVTELSGDL